MFLLPHLGTIIWVSIVFIIVFYILSKFAWKPLLKALEDREQSVESSLSAASEAEKKLQNLKDEQEAIISAARQEKEKILKAGIDQRDNIITTAKDTASAEAKKLLEEARKSIAREREAALVEMKNQIATLSIEIATKVVHADMDDKKRHEKLVDELIKDIDLN
ncbi:MAG: F0F1 ATP synthase subunit B [Prolixibacteraceae bacterium]|nr:F0F1 ATP synthase subunit B [Prolixibacteraceae bacterium]